MLDGCRVQGRKPITTITADSWLSDQLEKPVFNLAFPASSGIHPSLPDGPCLVSCRIDGSQTEVISELKAVGFVEICVNLTYEINAPFPVSSEIDGVRHAASSDRAAVGEVAAGSFEFDRFHQDPEIPDSTASELKSTWAKNFFLGRRGDFLLVAVSSQDIAGFVQIIKKSEDCLVIDLIAVEERFRNQGIATKLIESVMTRLSDKTRTVRAGTQAANARSRALYSRLGFKVVSEECVLHLHRGES